MTQSPARDVPMVPHSGIEGVEWPAVATGRAATLLALLQQLDRSHWWPAAEIGRRQRQQLRRIVAHAYRTVPFYRPRLDAVGYAPGQEISDEFWRSLPLLTRRDLGQSFAALASVAVPPGHGRGAEDKSSGSTGTPIRVLKTDLEQLFWEAFTLREEQWQRRDLSQTLVVIRAGLHRVAPLPEGAFFENWSVPVATIYPTGKMALLQIAAPIPDQAAWLDRIRPGYLLTVPSNLRALARHCRDHGPALSGLKGLRTVGEVLDAELRDECRDLWGVEIADMYSAIEVGYIALQCPAGEHYHVQSESVLVEVLDEAGRACQAGERGRVVLTSLHNFAMPLIRYEIGDLAVVGGPCRCGRGLPVLERVIGRVRDMLVLPSGERRYPTGLYNPLTRMPGLVQYQLVQKSLDVIEFRLVTRPPFTPADEAKLRDVVASGLGPHFAVSFVYLDEIPRAESGKFFEFVSEVAG